MVVFFTINNSNNNSHNYHYFWCPATLIRDAHSCRKIREDKMPGQNLGETGDKQRTAQEKDGKLKNLLKKSYLTRWVGGSDASDADSHLHYEKPTHHMDFAWLV